MRLLPMLAAAVCLLVGCATRVAEGGSEASRDWTEAWMDGLPGYEAAFRASREESRPVLVYFYTDWCGYCRQLESELLSDGTVIDFLASLHAVRVDAEGGAAESELARRYGVRGFPALYLHTDGEPDRFVSVRRTVSEEGGIRLKTAREFVEGLRRSG